MTPARLLLAAALTVTCTASPLRADDGAAAEALFEAGRDATKRGDTHEACAKFRESYRIDPAPGTKLNLAVCEGKLGRLALSWRLLRSLKKSLSPQDPRRRLVEELLTALEPRVPRVTFEPSGTLTPGVLVRLADAEISESGFRVPIPVDPGRASYLVSVPGRAPVSHTFDVREGERRTILVTAPASSAPPRVADTHARAQPHGTPALRTAGIIAFGAAASALAVGAATGLGAIEQKRTMDRLCTADGCEPGGVQAAGRGKTLAALSTWAFVGGAVLAGAGTTLIVLGGSAKRSSTVGLRLSPGGVALRAEL